MSSKGKYWATYTFGAAFLLAVVCSVILPLSHIQAALGESRGVVNLVSAPLTWTCLIVALVCAYVFRDAQPAVSRSSSPASAEGYGTSRSRTIDRSILAFMVVVSIVVLAVTVKQYSHAYYEWDELQSLWKLHQADSFSRAVSPFHHDNHFVAALSSWLTTRAFGLEKWAVRLPSLVYSALFLVSLSVLCHRFFSPFTRILVFSHVATNGLLTWYFISFRGYVSLVLTTTVLLLALLVAQRRGFDSISRAAVAVLFGLPFLAHSLGIVYSMGVLAGLLVWMMCQRKKLSNETVAGVWTICKYVALWIPMVAAVFIYHKAQLGGGGWLKGGLTGAVLQESLMLLFGMPFLWGRRLFALLALFTVLFSFRPRTDTQKLIGLHVIGGSVVLGSMVALMSVNYMPARFLLPWLVPLLLIVGESVSSLQNKLARRTVGAGFLILLMILPVFGRPGIREAVAGQSRWEIFFSEVREQASPLSHSCIKVLGNSREQRLAEDVFLANWQRDWNRNRCDRFFIADLVGEFGRGLSSSTSLGSTSNFLFGFNGFSLHEVEVPWAPDIPRGGVEH